VLRSRELSDRFALGRRVAGDGLAQIVPRPRQKFLGSRAQARFVRVRENL
jgi:hypothetical protein